jgi:hypothetical protein
MDMEALNVTINLTLINISNNIRESQGPISHFVHSIRFGRYTVHCALKLMVYTFIPLLVLYIIGMYIM